MREHQGIPLGPPRDVAGTRLSGAEPGSRSGLQNPKFPGVNTPLYCFLYVCVKAGKTLLKKYVLFLFIIFIYLFHLQLEKIDNTHHPHLSASAGTEDRGRRAHRPAKSLPTAGPCCSISLGGGFCGPWGSWTCGRQGEGCPLVLFQSGEADMLSRVDGVIAGQAGPLRRALAITAAFS